MAIKSGKHELIDTGTDKRYVKRNQDGTFKDSVDVGRQSQRIDEANRNQWPSLDTVIKEINRSERQRSSLRRWVRELQKSSQRSHADFGGSDAGH